MAVVAQSKVLLKLLLSIGVSVKLSHQACFLLQSAVESAAPAALADLVIRGAHKCDSVIGTGPQLGKLLCAARLYSLHNN